MIPLLYAAELACVEVYRKKQKARFIQRYEVKDSVCGIQYFDGISYIAYQGSNDFDDFLSNINIIPTNNPSIGAVHSGFNKNTDALIELICKDLHVSSKIIFTGHSKGAAEALISACKLKLLGYDVQNVILFACPNVGDKVFSEFVEKHFPEGISLRNAWREFSLWGDPIPLVPLFPYIAPIKHYLIESPPNAAKKYLWIEWHRARYYLKGAKVLQAIGAFN